jgi:hypothetical protein
MPTSTSLKTPFLSGGYSIQRNEMISIPQTKQRQRFQFMNEFNQTFALFDRAAQGLGRGAQEQLDRVPAYEIRSEKREVTNGVISSVKKPLTYKFATGSNKATLGTIVLTDGTSPLGEGVIQQFAISNGGQGYTPGAEYGVCVRGGNKSGTAAKPADIVCKADGNGSISSFVIRDGGQNYTLNGDVANGHPAMTLEIDETPLLGQFVVTRLNGETETTGVGAITSTELTSPTLTGHRPGVWFVSHNGSDKVISRTGTGVVENLKIQVFVNQLGTINKVTFCSYGEGFAVGDTLTIPQSQLGGIDDDVAGTNDLVLTVSTVSDQTQVDLDHGTAIWRSESFEAGVDVVMEYTIDTNIDTKTEDGFLRTFAKDLCLHPYANYYSSAWSKVAQRKATLKFTGAPRTAVFTGPAEVAATLHDRETDVALDTANDGFQAEDVGKRIIEPYGSGTMVITAVGPTDGVATCTMVRSLGLNDEDINTWDDPNQNEYLTDKWRLCIDQHADPDGTYPDNNLGGFESQPYNLIYPRIDEFASDHILIRDNGQQNHRDVMSCIRRIGDLFVVESEKATDLLSSLDDVNSASVSIPRTINLTQPVKDQRKPQKWRMRFYYDSRDEYLYVNVGTSLQILDNGDLTSGQGRDGIKNAVFRQPGELSEIYYNFSNDDNKAKSGFFRRQGKTDDGIDSNYPMAYRLTCTDHGTGFFLFDQASVDQDDDYAWFVVQRHVNNVSGKIEGEDGKSPVHCLYSPSKRPEETSDFNMGFFAEVSNNLDPETGTMTVTSKTLGDLEIFDVNGRKLTPGLPLNQSILTSGFPTMSRTTPYGQGTSYVTPPATGGLRLTDAANMGTDLTSGYSNVNDFIEFPPVTSANYTGLEKSNLDDSAVIDEVVVGGAVTEPAIYGFPMGYGRNFGSNFVLAGDYYVDMKNATRYTDSSEGDSKPSAFFRAAGGESVAAAAAVGSVGDEDYVAAVTAVSGRDDMGLSNYVNARNQMQGPAKLGLKLHRVRHRSASGFDTILDINDIQFINRSEQPPRVDSDNKPLELPVSSAVAIFTPKSSAALNLLKTRSIKIMYYDYVTFTYDGTTSTIVTPTIESALAQSVVDGSDTEPTTQNRANYNTATYDFSSTIAAITELGSADTTTPTDGTETNGPISILKTEIIPVPGLANNIGGSTQKYYAHKSLSDTDNTTEDTSGNGSFSTRIGNINAGGAEQVLPRVGDVVTLNEWVTPGSAAQTLSVTGAAVLDSSSERPAARITNILSSFPEGDRLIYEYAWEGAGHNSEYTNFYGRRGIGSNPLFETNRLKVFVDGLEADAAIQGINYDINSDGEIEFGATSSSLEYFGVEKPIYAYNTANDTLKFALPVEDNKIVKLSYENYNDVEERDTGKSTYLIKVPEDRDIPNIWNDIHKVSKGIYRFIVRENDVLKPWDYHVSAVIPQVDSPACINPVEQLSITQDKTVIFNFPTPLASQRFIYSDSEADLICIAGADSSTQGGIIKTSDTKFDLDSAQTSGYMNAPESNGTYPTTAPQYGFDADNIAANEGIAKVAKSSNGDFLDFRREYSWHNPFQGVVDTTADTAGLGYRAGKVTNDTAFDTPENCTHRTYLGMQSTKPYGNGMRLFILTRGGPIRPQYTDYTPRDQVDSARNTFS